MQGWHSFWHLKKSQYIFRPEGTRFSDGAYLLSYNILPVITPEYIYYMCKYGIWEKIVNNIKDGLSYEDKVLIFVFLTMVYLGNGLAKRHWQ